MTPNEYFRYVAPLILAFILIIQCVCTTSPHWGLQVYTLPTNSSSSPLHSPHPSSSFLSIPRLYGLFVLCDPQLPCVELSMDMIEQEHDGCVSLIETGRGEEAVDKCKNLWNNISHSRGLMISAILSIVLSLYILLYYTYFSLYYSPRKIKIYCYISMFLSFLNTILSFAASLLVWTSFEDEESISGGDADWCVYLILMLNGLGLISLIVQYRNNRTPLNRETASLLYADRMGDSTGDRDSSFSQQQQPYLPSDHRNV